MKSLSCFTNLRRRPGNVRPGVALALLALALGLQAAPFNRQFDFTQPDGTRIPLRGWGDEFQATFETLDGFTVVFDPALRAYCYARPAADGTLESTGQPVHRADPAALGLAPGLRPSPEARKRQVVERWLRWEQGMQTVERWREQKAAARRFYERRPEDGPQFAPPPFTTTGVRVGLTLLVDFSDDPATVPQAEIINFVNGDNYTGYGNNGSVKSYYYDNSNGRLLYTNVVTIYIRAPQAKTVYNDVGRDAGECGNLLLKEALDAMKALPNYTTEILPTFDALSVDANNRVLACNVFFAGANSGVWSRGLWPHSWALVIVGEQELSPGGKRIWRYQITDIGNRLEIGTFCHENGHMLCGYPDLYDYDYDSVGGAGMFCLMGYGGDGGNPVQICAYLKRASGWATVTELNAASSMLATVTATHGSNFNHFYRFQKPGVPTEYYLVENRQRQGRDARIPASGVAIWHVDELGDRDNQSTAYNSVHANYECSLVQADNQFHFQRNINSGDARDLYYAGNPAPGYANEFSDDTAPSARWWDGTLSGVVFADFSESGDTMTFRVGSGLPVLRIESVLLPGGNGNGRLDPNECNPLRITLTNAGLTAATSVELTLSTRTPGAAVTRGRVSVPLIPGMTLVADLPPFEVSTAEDFVCGTPVDFMLVIKSDQVVRTNEFRLPSGQVGAPRRFNSTATYPIPDNDPVGVYAPILVTNLPGPVGKVAVSLHLQHTYVSDLTLELISPDGRTNRLAAGVGGSGDNFGLGCAPDSARTTFDDDATNSLATAVAPFAGVFQPQQPLAVFQGITASNAAGIWWLRVVDTEPADIGLLQCWSLFLYPAICEDGGGACPGTDLAVTLRDMPDPVVLGSNLVYTLVVTNHGPNPGKATVATLNLPAGVVFLSATTTRGTVSHAGGVVTANLGTLPVGASAIITVTGLPVLTGVLLASATVSSSEPEILPANNVANQSTLVLTPTADLALSLDAAPNPTIVGGPVTCTATVINNGPAPASGVLVSNALPPAMLITAASSSKGSVTLQGNVVLGLIGSLQVGESATVTLQVVPLAAGNHLALARVYGNLNDPVLANNLATTLIGVGEAADLGITLVDVPDPVVVNSNFTYQITVTNAGPNAAAQVVVNHTLPGGGYTVTSHTASQGTVTQLAGALVWNVGNLAVGQTATLTVVGRTPNAGTLLSSASVAGAQADPNPTNNTASASTVVAPPFVAIQPAGAVLLSESFHPPNGAVDPGETVTVLLRLRNAGNVANTNLTAVLRPGGGVTAQSGPQLYGVLAPGGGDLVGRPFTFTAAGDYGGLVTATLQLVDAGRPLPDVSFVFELPRVAVFVNPAAIAIPHVGSATPYPSTINVAGLTGTVGRVTVTLSNFTHTYPADVDVLLVGPLGQKALVMSGAGDRYSVTNITVTLDDTAAVALPQSDALVTGAFRPAAYLPGQELPAPAPAAPYAEALSAFAGLDPNGTWSLYVADHTPGDAGHILAGWSLRFELITPVNRQADLALTGTVTPAMADVGQALTWTFTVTNRGPDTAAGVWFSNALPAGLTVESVTVSQGSADSSSAGVMAQLGELAANASATVAMVTVPTTAGTFTNVATVGSGEIDLNPANNVAIVTAAADWPVADLAVFQDIEPVGVVVQSNLLLTLTLTNAGPGAALAAVLTNLLPLGFAVAEVELSQGTFAIQGQTFRWQAGALAAGSTAQARLLLQPQLTGSFVNRAQAVTASADPDPDNNLAEANVQVVPPRPILEAAGRRLLSESHLPANGALDPGETVTMAFGLRNAGQLPTANLLATLRAEGGVTSPSGPQTYGALLPDGVVAFRNFSFTVADPAPAGIVATLELTDGGVPLGTVSFPLDVVRQGSLASASAILIPDRGPATPYPSVITVTGMTGQVVQATVTLHGLTHSFPDDVDVLLVGPQGQNVILMSDAGGGRSITNVTLTFDDRAGASLPDSERLVSGTYRPTNHGPGDSFPAPAPGAPHGSSLAALAGADPNGDWKLFIVDDAVGDLGAVTGGWELHLATAELVNPLANLHLHATAQPPTVFVGLPVTYTLQVTNLGPATATEVMVTQTLPAGADLISVNWSRGMITTDPGQISFDIGSLAAGDFAHMTVVVRPSGFGGSVSHVAVAANETDLDPSDNTATLTTLVIAPIPAQLTGVYDAGVFRVDLTGQPGLTYVLQASPDLVTWTGLATNTAPESGVIKFADPQAGSLSRRFYRAVWWQP